VRIVSWNCNGAFRRKFKLLDALDGDVLVVQECENPVLSAPDYREWAANHIWVGRLQSRGLGIFPRRGQRLERLPWHDAGLRYFLPARLDNKVTILGVWTQNARPRQASYVGQLWNYLEMHRSALGSDSIIAGDFNSNAIWDHGRPTWNHSNCVKLLADSGLQSAYHAAHHEAHGNELQPTYFQFRHLDRPYHIDYVFAHESLLAGRMPIVSIGSAEKWLSVSDHMPIMVDI
jgi:endonuclease/exonuclease/phosphatase family metal-dependent hydrolase